MHMGMRLSECIEGARQSAERHVGAFVVIDREAPDKRPPSLYQSLPEVAENCIHQGGNWKNLWKVVNVN